MSTGSTGRLEELHDNGDGQQSRQDSDLLVPDTLLQHLKPTSSNGLQPNSNGLRPNSDCLPPRAGLQPRSYGLQPKNDGLQPKSDDLQPNSDRLQPNSDGLQPNEITPAKAKNLVYFVGSMTSVPTLQIVLCRITKENQWRERTKTQDKVDIFTWSKCLSNQESFWDLRGLAERWSDRWWAWGIL